MKGWLITTDNRGVERSFFVALPDREEAAAILMRDIGRGTILTRSALSEEEFRMLGLYEGEIREGSWIND